MALVEKNDIKQIFADQAPSIDKPATFANYPRGWDTSRQNNGKPTIKQFNYLQQRTDQNFLWMHQNGAALPYDATMEYAEGAPVVKDGRLQQKQGDSWVNVGGAKTAAELMDESGKDQQEINNIIQGTRLWVEQFANSDDLKIDAGPAFRRAIAYAKDNNFDTVWFRGNYKITSLETEKWVMPFDDGSLPSSLIPSDAHGVLPPESTTLMSVHLFVPSGIGIKSENFRYNSLDFGWSKSTGGINTDQKIGIVQTCVDWDGTYLPVANCKNRYTQVSRGQFGGFTLQNCFHGFIGDGVRQYDDWDFMRFINCGISFSFQGVEASEYKGFHFTNCYAGGTMGGWWLQRAANSYGYMPIGFDIFSIGWCDACKIGKVEYFFATDASEIPRFNLINEYFDTYFWKSQNNATRLSTTTNGTTPNAGSIIKYRGIAGRTIYESPRQKRAGFNNEIGLLKVYGTPVPPVFCFGQWKATSAFAERVGLLDRRSGSPLTDANNFFKSEYNLYHDINFVPSCVIEQEDSASSSSYCVVLNVSRHNTFRAPAVADSNGIPKGFLQVDGGIRVGNIGDVLDETQRYEQLDFQNASGQTIIRQTTPKHVYQRGGLSWRSSSLTNVATSGEILLKEEAYPSTVVNPEGKIRGFIGSEATPFETNGYISWYRKRNQTEVYLDVNITSTIRTSGAMRIYLRDYAKNPPVVGDNQLFGFLSPMLDIARLPTLTSEDLIPKAAQITTSGSTKGEVLVLFTDFAAISALEGNAFSADGWLRIKVTYRCEKWD